MTGHADVAQLVEHHLAKVRVAGSNPVVRSKCDRPSRRRGGVEAVATMVTLHIGACNGQERDEHCDRSRQREAHPLAAEAETADVGGLPEPVRH